MYLYYGQEMSINKNQTQFNIYLLYYPRNNALRVKSLDILVSVNLTDLHLTASIHNKATLDCFVTLRVVILFQ